jgi:hypothetical protein
MKRLPISITAVFEMLTASEFKQYPTLDHWLCRQLEKPHAEGLSPEAKRHRRLAQTRLCRARQKMVKAVARHDATSRHPTRDIIDLSPVIIPT